ncbi:hypothetical protein [Tenggerimyces flavus]|uniref:Uncharacterized protein n=1 Tax=Tenggerimyces flavus TaxID=1708749 RepID=A0ABV7YHU9_9ACTN|nr:hypothetical protein [Tenggerimyces flavus]MBM7787862.1 hypothetical protein [Tenggerimyces flavus]
MPPAATRGSYDVRCCPSSTADQAWPFQRSGFAFTSPLPLSATTGPRAQASFGPSGTTDAP